MTTQGDSAAGRSSRPEPAAGPTTATPEVSPTDQAEPTAPESDAVEAAMPEPTGPPEEPNQPAPEPTESAPTEPEPPAPEADPTPPAGGFGPLITALTDLRDTVGSVRYPLATPEAEEATRAAAAIHDQLDDYLLPRLDRLDAPLLVVVGGSTGAGKSTLVNSIVRAPVSAAGVLRPTTRAPVLVCHPQDAPWFTEARLLPGLTRTTHRPSGTDSLQVISAQGLTPGLAFLDAPDIDSVVEANRTLAVQLLAAADLWLFVTTAARYADAVPWELLRSASTRGTAVALVLDRVPPGAADAIGPHLTGMLRANDLGAAPLFVLPETKLEAQGLLSDRIVSPLRDWFAGLAKSADARAAVVRQTVDGALSALRPAVEQLADTVDAQVKVAESLSAGVLAAYGDAETAVDQGVRDGTLLRGEVLARWQELVGTGELMRGLQARVGRLRDRVAAVVIGRPDPGQRLQAALGSGLVALVSNAAADAAERAVGMWRVHPAGAALLETPAGAHLGAPSPDLPQQIERLIRDWQRGVLELVRAEAGDKRAFARASALAVNATGLLVMVSVFVATSLIPTGIEIAVAGGTTVAAQKVLEAIFGDQAIRDLAGKARQDLSARIHDLLTAEAARFLSVLEQAGIDATAADRLRGAAAATDRARAATALAGAGHAALPQPTLNGTQR